MGERADISAGVSAHAVAGEAERIVDIILELDPKYGSLEAVLDSGATISAWDTEHPLLHTKFGTLVGAYEQTIGSVVVIGKPAASATSTDVQAVVRHKLVFHDPSR